MNEAIIENKLKELIGNMVFSGYTVAWPNQEHNGVKPYIFVQVVRLQRTDPSLRGGQAIVSRGQLVCTMVTALNTSTFEANDTAQELADCFPKGRVIPFTGGQMIITDCAIIREGYKDGNDWRIPIVIPYTAYGQ